MGIKSSLRNLLLVAVASVAYVLIVDVVHVGAQAARGTGYFTGRSFSTPNPPSVSQNDVLSGSRLVGGSRVGYAVPANLNNGQQVYNWLRGVYNNNSPNSRDQIGATFIVKTMIGLPGGNQSKSLTQANWDELHRRLVQNPNIRVYYTNGAPSNYGNGRVSFYSGGSNGENFFATNYPKWDRVPLLIIEDATNNTRYVLERYCANPVGGLSLPTYDPDEWNITGSSSVNRTTATPGQTITWTHSIRNNGPDRTSQGIRSWSQITGFGNGWNGENDVRTLTLNNGGTRTAFNRSSYTVQQSDIGRTLCQQVQWRPRAHNNTGTGNGTNRCVTIVAAPWQVNGQTRVKVGSGGTYTTNQITAAPNQVLYWEHRLTRSGTGNPNSVSYQILRYVEGGASVVLANGTTSTLPFTRSADSIEGYRRTVTQNDVGNTICQSLTWNPRANNNAGSTTTRACAAIPYNYQLQPQVRTSTSEMVESGTVINVDRNVRVTGPTKSRPSEWRMSEVIIRPGASIPNEAGGTSASPQEPCVSYFRPSDGSCDEVDRGSGVVFMPPNNPINPVNRTIPDLPAGSRICWGLSVRDRSHNSNEWRHSALECLIIGKRPKVQFWGADVRSGQQVYTSKNTVNDRDFGAWAEYGIIGRGSVVSSSGAGLSGDASGRPVQPPLSYNPLTFANTGPSFGNFGTISLSDPTATLSGTTNIGPSVDVGHLNGNYRRAGNVIITGGTLGTVASGGRSVVIEATGTVRIEGDIFYDNGTTGYGRASELPQLIIKAGNIIISPNVREVNAWLIATDGYISTCGPVNSPSNWLSYSAGVSFEQCSEHQLRINGPVVADRLYLRRAWGGESAHRNMPAEILNLRPDAYLWAHNRARESSSIQTMYVRELPPRF